MADLAGVLREAAELAREAELANDAIDTINLCVLPDAIVIKAERNGYLSLSPRRVCSLRAVPWEQMVVDGVAPFRERIAEVVDEMNMSADERASLSQKDGGGG